MSFRNNSSNNKNITKHFKVSHNFLIFLLSLYSFAIFRFGRRTKMLSVTKLFGKTCNNLLMSCAGQCGKILMQDLHDIALLLKRISQDFRFR